VDAPVALLKVKVTEGVMPPVVYEKLGKLFDTVSAPPLLPPPTANCTVKLICVPVFGVIVTVD